MLTADHLAFETYRLNGSLSGEHVHAFSDFKQSGPSIDGTPNSRGMLLDVDGLNYKGLFSRNRQPKAAAALITARYAMIQRDTTKKAH